MEHICTSNSVIVLFVSNYISYYANLLQYTYEPLFYYIQLFLYQEMKIELDKILF